MEWYIPITILPGIGLLILSTSNFLIALNNEIKELNIDKEKYQSIVTEKIGQLKKLTYALIAQYLSAFSFVVSGIFGEISKIEGMMIYLAFTGVVFLAISIVLLIHYSIRTLKIRQQHFKL